MYLLNAKKEQAMCVDGEYCWCWAEEFAMATMRR